MSESFQPSYNAADRAHEIITHAEAPKNPEELQAQLIEEYYVRTMNEKGITVDAEQFNADFRLQMEAAKLWKESGMAEAWRAFTKDPNRGNIMDVTLETLPAYLGKPN